MLEPVYPCGTAPVQRSFPFPAAGGSSGVSKPPSTSCAADAHRWAERSALQIEKLRSGTRFVELAVFTAALARGPFGRSRQPSTRTCVLRNLARSHTAPRAWTAAAASVSAALSDGQSRKRRCSVKSAAKTECAPENLPRHAPPNPHQMHRRPRRLGAANPSLHDPQALIIAISLLQMEWM